MPRHTTRSHHTALPADLDVRPCVKDDPLSVSAPSPPPATELPLPLAIVPRDHLININQRKKVRVWHQALALAVIDRAETEEEVSRSRRQR